LCASKIKASESFGDGGRVRRLPRCLGASSWPIGFGDGIAAHFVFVTAAARHRKPFGDHQRRRTVEVAIVCETELKSRRH
jgi:hypothetical protein